MSRLDIAITQKMINAWYLFHKNPDTKKENLYRIWERETRQSLDMTQRKWIEMCMKGDRKVNITSRHGKHYMSQQQMMKPTHANQKALTHTLDVLPKDEFMDIQKSLKGN